MSELFNLKENHSGGCLFLDNSLKNIIIIGGDTSKKVEKFSFEDGELEELPELPDFISKMTCIQIGNKIYSLFGIAKEGKENDKSPILCLDLDDKDRKLSKLDKSLPESKNKKYIFTQNTQFNIFIDRDNVLYANIDDNNQIHIIDNELHHDLYLTPSEI